MQKYYHATAFAFVLLFITACGVTLPQSDQNDNTQQQTQQTQQPRPSDLNTTPLIDDADKSVYTCPDNTASDRNFADSYITNHTADIAWPDDQKYNKPSVAAIEAIFNAARKLDPTVTAPMVLPPQTDWDAMNSGEKVLYLVNKARCDRGLKPFEGLDPTITDVAQSYADYIAAHYADYQNDPHNADGSTPWERMQQDGGVEVGTNADFFRYGENIASFGVGTSLHNYPEIYESEAKAVYGWLYEDVAGQASPYGHRKFLLAKQLVENSGAPNAEGLVGIGKARRQYIDDNGYYWSEDIIVMDGFDPRASWDADLSHTEHVDLWR